MSDWSEPNSNEDNDGDEDEIFVGYFEDSEALQVDEPTQNDPRLAHPTGVYQNLRQADQKPVHFDLHRTEIPITPREPKGNAFKQYTLPEPICEVDPPLRKIKQEVQDDQ